MRELKGRNAMQIVVLPGRLLSAILFSCSRLKETLEDGSESCILEIFLAMFLIFLLTMSSFFFYRYYIKTKFKMEHNNVGYVIGALDSLLCRILF